ncbi:MAG: DUF5056 domain-containing protein [Prevotella sp.]|nr:DUF5056 domain-containing protein [Prevotella sp.]
MEEIKNNNMFSNDEELVELFFNEQKTEIADDGFTHRVVSHLPGQSSRLNHIWTTICIVLTIAAVILSRAWEAAWGMLRGLIADVATIDAPSAPMVVVMYLVLLGFAVVGCLGLLSAERKLAL